nr:E3 ubiquitin-protein ligase APD1-like isoform X1 [Nicotiana tomentosiformis]
MWQEKLTRLLALLSICICVLLSIRYGLYGDCDMVLGPNSSRLLRVSSLFVKQVEVRDDDKTGISLYGFSEKPELSVEAKWSSSKSVLVGSYSRKGFSLWLNKGSRIRIKWQAQSSILSQLEVSLMKGERKHENVLSTNSARFDISNGTTYEAAYRIEEDDRYNIGIINQNSKGVTLLMNVNISPTIYNIKKAKSICSTNNGPCRLDLSYPSTQYVVLATPDTYDLSGVSVAISYIARLVTYVGILGVAVIIICFILKSLGACDDESYAEETSVTRIITETDPMLPHKDLGSTYGTYAEDANSGRSSSSEDLYDGKICVICYDNPRNCFFVPCGHCATCQECAQRIMDVESKVCPVCRRPIHKVRKLIIP